jgi:hypothetical protein
MKDAVFRHATIARSDCCKLRVTAKIGRAERIIFIRRYGRADGQTETPVHLIHINAVRVNGISNFNAYWGESLLGSFRLSSMRTGGRS